MKVSETEKRRALELALIHPLKQADRKASLDVFSTSFIRIVARGRTHYLLSADEALMLVQGLREAA